MAPIGASKLYSTTIKDMAPRKTRIYNGTLLIRRKTKEENAECAWPF